MGKQAPVEGTEIAARLESIYQQIKNYPTPIAGCDEQFDFLLTERGRLQKELERFREV